MDFVMFGVYLAAIVLLLWPAACLAENRLVTPAWVFGEEMGHRFRSLQHWSLRKKMPMDWVVAVAYRTQLAAITSVYILFVGPLLWEVSPFGVSMLYWIDAMVLCSLVAMRLSSDAPGGFKAISRVGVLVIVAIASFWTCSWSDTLEQGAYVAYAMASLVAWSFPIWRLTQKIAEIPLWISELIRGSKERFSN